MSAPLHRRDHRTRPASPAAGRFSATPSGRARQRTDRIIQRPAPRLGSGARAEGLARGPGVHAHIGRLRSAPLGRGVFTYPPADPYTRMGGGAVPALAANRYPDPACHARGFQPR